MRFCVGSRHYICHLCFRIKIRQKMRIENREMPAETKTVQEPHSLVISHESLLSLERGSLRVFRWYETLSEIKVGVMLWPLLATKGYQTLSMMAPVCA